VRASPSYGQVVDGDLAQVLLVVDDEKSAERNSRLLVEHTVVAGDLAALVRQQRDAHLTETALFTRCVYPREMTEVGIGGRGDHVAADVGKLLYSVGESDDFRRAHESAAAK